MNACTATAALDDQNRADLDLYLEAAWVAIGSEEHGLDTFGFDFSEAFWSAFRSGPANDYWYERETCVARLADNREYVLCTEDSAFRIEVSPWYGPSITGDAVVYVCNECEDEGDWVGDGWCSACR